MDAVKLIGLATCDSCRAARAALQASGVAVTFRDVRADPPTRAEIEACDPAALLLAHPTLMKRPVLIRGDRMLLGWDRDAPAALGLS